MFDWSKIAAQLERETPDTPPNVLDELTRTEKRLKALETAVGRFAGNLERYGELDHAETLRNILDEHMRSTS